MLNCILFQKPSLITSCYLDLFESDSHSALDSLIHKCKGYTLLYKPLSFMKVSCPSQEATICLAKAFIGTPVGQPETGVLVTVKERSGLSPNSSGRLK